MIDISVNRLVKSFDLEKKILDGITFQIDTGERVGLLGKNGAGKTTLFRILTGELDYDEGQVMVAPGRRVGLISQIPVYPDGYTVEDVLRSAFERMFRMKEEMDRLTEQMAAGDSSSQTLKRYGELTARFEGLGGYDTDTAVNKVANGLSIDTEMRQRLFDQLSGGEKTRVNLGRLILEDTDILLLDEPTNHLDLQATEWLEEYIRTFRGTVVTISHDRYFLDRTVTRIIEVLDGKAEFYSGNYSFYAVEKERRYQERLKQYLKEQAKIQQLEKAAEQMHLWAFMGNDALHKRAFSMEKRIQRMRTTEKPTKAKKMDARFASRQFKGDEVLQVKGVSKAFDGRTLFSDIYLRVEDGERIALIGENGTGKTTLLNMLLGIEPTDSGIFKLGPSVKAVYLPQIIHFDHPERSILDTMLYEKKGMTAQSARNRLAAYQFQGEDVFKPVSVLSGGELSRLMLALELVAAEKHVVAGGSVPPMTFIFDEVDAGVGGKTAVELGARLAKLAQSSQVIVVTHLPQVASWADEQYVVAKGEMDDGSIATTINQVRGEARVHEIARMLSGSESEASLEHAEELLKSSVLD